MQIDIGGALVVLEKRKPDMMRYAAIMESVRLVDVSADADFQRLFTGFYRVRRNIEWRTAYYSLFEWLKQVEHPTFEMVFPAVCYVTGNVEASFASKMLATLDPSAPIWDALVLQNLGLRLEGTSKAAKMNDALRVYGQIAGWYANFMRTESAAECVRRFDETFPEFQKFSSVKKVDFLLWSSRQN